MKAAPKQANNDSNRSVTNASQSSWQNQLAQVVNTSKEAVAQRAFIDGLNDSPRMLAQRRQIDGYLSSSQQVATDPPHSASQNNQQETIQRAKKLDEEDKNSIQRRFVTQVPAQLELQPVTKSNNTGLPDNLKSGIESLSGISMDNVKVHYNSTKPKQLNALAYAQGTDIHVAPGQERHLPHEAWHLVQQKQGRVQPTLQAKGVAINDDPGLEHEADVMGEKAKNRGMKRNNGETGQHSSSYEKTSTTKASEIRQRKCKCSEEKRDLSTMAVLQRTCYNPVPLGPYAKLPEDKSNVDNKDFTDKQADAILAANTKNTNWVRFDNTPIYSSDLSGEALLHSSVTRPAEATVDHILPYESGGCNSVKNAQILSSSENSSKGKTWPWGKYQNYKKYVQ